MNSLLAFCLISFLIAGVVYLAMALLLILFGLASPGESGKDSLDFKVLKNSAEQAAPLEQFRARDGTELGYRYYPAKSDRVLLLIHGSGGHSLYFSGLSCYLSSENLAHVYTPDLRGHGPNPQCRGDVDYIGQYEDDLADLIRGLRDRHPEARIILGGHSSGGGLVIRFAGSRYAQQADGFLLLAPYLQYNAPTLREDSGGWALPHVRRIIGLILLNNLGIRWLNGLKVIDFNMPAEVRDGNETLAYSYRLNTSYAPRDYKKDLAAIRVPTLVIVGAEDDAFYAERFAAVLDKYPGVELRLLPGVNHMGAVVSDEVRPVIRSWLETSQLF